MSISFIDYYEVPFWEFTLIPMFVRGFLTW